MIGVSRRVQEVDYAVDEYDRYDRIKTLGR
jgi:hypothetical protein